jgi:DNA-binding IclR family transcriptional regulator
MAAPVWSRRPKVEGAIGLSTTARRIHDEGRRLTEMVQWAAEEASAMLKEEES